MSNARGTAFDVIIIGAGAAGMMCAMTAGARGRRVLLLDHADAPGKKILISGGGRCNFTNLYAEPENFLSGNPHFCKSALARYTQHDFIALIDKHGIAWHEKTLGQLFCDGSAKAVIAMLLAECDSASVDVRLNHRVTDISRSEIGSQERFRVTTDKSNFTAESVVLASGGLSIPKMGATGFAHDVARRFGLKLCDIRPGLVPLTFTDGELDMMRSLSGVALDCVATTSGLSGGRTDFAEAMLFTPSRPVRPGDPADIVLLAGRRGDRAEHAARRRCRCPADRRQARPAAGRGKNRSVRSGAVTPCRRPCRETPARAPVG